MAPSYTHRASLVITFSCAYLPDATSFVAGYSDGQLALHAPQLPAPVEEGEEEEEALPIGTSRLPSRHFSWDAHHGAVYCTKVWDGAGKTLIVSGGDKHIRVWDHSAVLACAEKHMAGDLTATLRPRLEISPEGAPAPPPLHSQVPETNDVAWLPSTSVFAAAHGDGQIGLYNAETGQMTGALAGHQGAVLSVAAPRSTALLSGGDDCVVRMWDVRALKCCRSFLPFTGETTATGTMKASGGLPAVNCLAVDPGETWMACGGRCNYLTLWHLPSASLSAALPTATPAQAVLFDDTQIVSGGSEPYVSFWGHTGKLKARVPVQAPSVYALASNAACPTPVPLPKALLVAGLGPAVDVFGEGTRRRAILA